MAGQIICPATFSIGLQPRFYAGPIYNTITSGNGKPLKLLA